MLIADVLVKNNNSDAQNVLAITALYDQNNRMVNVSYLSKDIAIGTTEKLSCGFKLPTNVEGYKVQVFVWEGASLEETNMVPLSNVVTLE